VSATGPGSLARRAFARAGFPLLIAVTMGGAAELVARGVEPATAIAPFIVLAFVFLGVAERLLPLHESWLHARGDLRTDVGLFLTSAVVHQLLAPLLLAAAAFGAARLSATFGAGLWPGWSLWATVPLALLVAELWEYTGHRAMHEVPALWRLHATHHSAPRLYWLNAARFHPLDLLLVGVGKLVPLVLLGAGAAELALVSLFSAVHGAYQHANVPVRLGALNWIFSMAELHRWHHAPDAAEANHNYGGNLIVWDVVFGTRYLPADREPPERIGIAELPRFPMGFAANLLSPFRWRRIVATARGPHPAEGP
jgi:sterol desaturase/sphingolipid hydroxylase (fatty acid hydroxylase superfamily)